MGTQEMPGTSLDTIEVGQGAVVWKKTCAWCSRDEEAVSRHVSVLDKINDWNTQPSKSLLHEFTLRKLKHINYIYFLLILEKNYI